MISSDWRSQISEKISLVLPEIAYNDSLQWCLTSSIGKINEKNFSGPKFGPKVPKSGPKLVLFLHFLKFGSLVFLEIAYKDSLQQCITSSRGKTYKKFLGGLNFDQNGPNSGPELVFLPFSQIWFIGLPLNCIGW